MCRFKLLSILFSMLLLYTSCIGNDDQAFDFSKRRFLITSNGDKQSAEEADYLYSHLLKRTRGSERFQLTRSDEIPQERREAIIYLEIVLDLASDYEIKNEENRLSIFAREKTTMTWLIYMLIDRLASFHSDIDVSDLAPGYLQFQSGIGKFAMRYREPHLLPNMDPDYAGTLGTHGVDNDWGLWGHNLARVFVVDGIADSSYAWVDGKRNKQQFCFSSGSTFRAIRNFIVDEYGDGNGSPKWFMIAPNDNALVCNCVACQADGNTPTNATESVVRLLNKLAKTFPAHHFFTTAYHTTAKAPVQMMESNTGVFISTIDLPKRPLLAKNDPSVRAFLAVLDAWKDRTTNIYVWDYISNFDDYLTPYPVLSRLKSNLPFFEEQGVSGIFLNGSGYDYSPLDDVKTFVMAALLHDASLPLDQLVKAYFKRFYPSTNELLSSYYLKLEERQLGGNTALPVYFSFREAETLYFQYEEFIQLYGALNKALPNLWGPERQRIDKVLTAWSYTYLQVLYHRGYSENGLFVHEDNQVEVPDRLYLPLDRLKKVQKYTDLKRYKESGGELAIYLEEWEELLKRRFTNKILEDIQVKGLNTTSILDEGELLNDRMLGFASDFNQGWLLTSEDLEVTGTIEKGIEPIKKIVIRFLTDTRHRMLAPEKIELLKDGRSLGKVYADKHRVQGNSVTVELPVHLEAGEKLQIKIWKSKRNTKSVIACDEIQLL